MASKSNPLNSIPLSSTYIPSNKESMKTNNGTKQVQLLTSKSKCAIVAFVVGGIAGVVIIILGTTNLFGPVKSIGFVASIAGGGTVVVIATGGVIWIAISNCKRSEEGVKTKKEKSGVSGKSNNKPYSEIGAQAIAFARQKLSKHSKIKPCLFAAGLRGTSGTNQPINQEIALLMSLYKKVYDVLERRIKKHVEPWSQATVIRTADDLIKIAYAISCLTLEDLPAFTQALESKGIKRTYVEALTMQDSYQYRTYYCCTRLYHGIRSGMTWSKHWSTEEEGLFSPEKAPEAHAASFYQKGTIQSSWRALYNDYCDRVKLYVKMADLERADSRHFAWIKKDNKEKTFDRVPDTLPT